MSETSGLKCCDANKYKKDNFTETSQFDHCLGRPPAKLTNV